MSSDSSSESDSEERSKLQAAVIDIGQVFPSYTKPSISAPQKSFKSSAETRAPATGHSERGDTNIDDKNVLNTTPEFRAHVSKKLMEIIDSSIKVKPMWNTKSDRPQQSSEPEKADIGIKLFSASKSIHTLEDPNCSNGHLPQRKRPNRNQPSDSSESEDEAMLASVAVSGEMILSQGCLVSPSTRDKGCDETMEEESHHILKEEHSKGSDKQTVSKNNTHHTEISVAEKHSKKHKKKKKKKEICSDHL